MTDLTISTIETDDGVVVVYLTGPVALGDTSAKLHKTLRDLVQEEKQQILINLEGVTTLDSSGLGTLVAAYTTVEKAGGQMKLTNLPTRVTELMTITKLYTVFDIFDDEITAIDSFKKTNEAAAAETGV
jgi:anti-sigma B factor antagonist